MNEPLNILITGGTGSLGSALVERWYHTHRLTVLSRNPHAQAKLNQQYPKIKFILSDICNAGEVKRACTGQDVLIHAAALKQLDVGEYHPAEFARVNVQGSITVADAWAETFAQVHPETGLPPTWPRIALLISTDKAVSALNTYGATKKVAEGIFRKRDYSVLRYGNVVESRGSFLKRWKRAIEINEPVEIRKPEPTRFFLAMKDAVDLIEDVLKRLRAGADNGIFVPRRMRAFSVWDVAKAAGVRTITSDLLPYEKQHERLVAEGEEPIPESPLLSRIQPGWAGQKIDEYISVSASGMTGLEFLEVVEW